MTYLHIFVTDRLSTKENAIKWASGDSEPPGIIASIYNHRVTFIRTSTDAATEENIVSSSSGN